MTPHRPEPALTIVASLSSNRVIGADGDLVWRNREDLQRVKAMTMGHTLVMGRKNFDSIGRPLPGRRSVVVTRNRQWHHVGVTVVHDTDCGLYRALREMVAATGDPEIFIFGGGEIYRALLPHADAMELTEIHTEIAGDVRFPAVTRAQWRCVRREERDGFDWVRYERVGNAAPLCARLAESS